MSDTLLADHIIALEDEETRLRARIEALEEGAHRLNRKIEWWEDKYRQQAWRTEALETALRRIDAINDSPACFSKEIDDVCCAALAPEQDK